MSITSLIAAVVKYRPPKGVRRIRLPIQYRAGGALLARGKWNPPDKRNICMGTTCNCHKHLKHAKKGVVTR